MAGRASSTTMTRFRVEVVSTTMAPRAACTRPRRRIPIQPKRCGRVRSHAAIPRTAKALIIIPVT